MPALPFVVEQRDRRVTTVRMEADGPGWEQWFLLRSDVHHDNEHCNQFLERAHLLECKDKRAGLLDFGDYCSAMQGRWDPRGDQSHLRSELRGNDYYDKVVAYNADYLIPFAENVVHLSPGNHETAVNKRHGTDLTERIGERLKAVGSQVKVGTYQGWVSFCFTFNKTKRRTYRLRYTHGYGGGGPVTKDVIQANRQLVYLDNCDFLLSGHTHDQWWVTYRRETLNRHGVPDIRNVECLKCPGYKDEYSPGEGWCIEKGHPPKPLGAWWIRFFLSGGHDPSIHYQIVRAEDYR